MVVRVRAVREHNNVYGDKVRKAQGDEYDLPDNLVETLTNAGLVEKVKGKADKPKADKPAS